MGNRKFPSQVCFLLGKARCVLPMVISSEIPYGAIQRNEFQRATEKIPFFLGWTWDQIHLQRVPTLLNLVLFELGTLSSSYNIVLHRNQMILASNLDPFSAWKSTFHTTQVHVPSLFWHKSDQVKIYVFGIMFFFQVTNLIKDEKLFEYSKPILFLVW